MKIKRIIISVILLVVLVSCGNKQKPTEIKGLTDEVYFEEVGSAQSIGLAEHYELLIQQTTAGNDEVSPEYLEYLQGELESAEEYIDECIEQSGANADWDSDWEGADGKGGKNRVLGYRFSTIRYKSIDHNGNPAMLSALVVWPYNNILSDPDANNVIIGCHITISSNAERPTNYNENSIKSDVGMLACCAKRMAGVSSKYDNLVIIPDYQGYGATHGDVHPYLSQDLTARQVLDGVRAGIAYYQKTHKLEKDWRSVSTGYSQGGSVAMAVHRYIEKNNLVKEFNFAGSVCGSGPYDPIATLRTYIETGKVYMPVAAAMMMYSMCKTNPRLMGKYSPKDFLDQPFLDSDLLTKIEEKKLNTDQIQDSLLAYSAKQESTNDFYMNRLAKDGYYYPYLKDTKDKHEWAEGYIRTAYAETALMLEGVTLDYFRSNGKPVYNYDYSAAKELWAALEDNVLYRDWTPSHPIFLYHTEEDEVVVIYNYHNCLNAWRGSDMVKGAIYKGPTETHVSYGSYFYMVHCGQGIKAILDGRVNEYPFSRIIKGDI